MNVTSASVNSGLKGTARPTATGVRNSSTIGTTDSFTFVAPNLPNIVGALAVTAAAAANVATLTLATLVMVATTGSPVIADGDGKDMEGVTFPALAKIQAIRLRTPDTNTGDVVIAGSSGGRLPGITLGPGADITCLYTLGQTLSAATLIATFAGAGQQLFIDFLGKSA